MSYLKNDVILVRYPFSNLSEIKVRPAVIVNADSSSKDSLIVPLSSRTAGLFRGEFVLTDWPEAGLNVPSAVKRGIYTVEETLTLRKIGTLSQRDAQQLELSLRTWLGLRK